MHLYIKLPLNQKYGGGNEMCTLQILEYYIRIYHFKSWKIGEFKDKWQTFYQSLMNPVSSVGDMTPLTAATLLKT